MNRNSVLPILVVVLLIVGSLPAGAFAASSSAVDDHGGEQATTGQQLATVIEVTDDEVSSELESVSFATAFENATSESERAVLLAERAETLRDRTATLRETRSDRVSAFENGTLSQHEFAQSLALTASQANTLEREFGTLEEYATTVSALELRAADYNRSANEAARDTLATLQSAGSSALLAQYTGEQRGGFSVEVDNGISIEVESEDGEQSREFERERNGSGTFEITQSEALNAAYAALSQPENSEWTLRAASTDEDDGAFEFEFALSATGHSGEAEVEVDGETGEVFELEEEISRLDDDDADEVALSVSLVNGTAAPNEKVTLAVTVAGEPVENAAVEFDDQPVGTTDANGELTVTLPDDDEVDVEVESGEREGELELSLRSPDTTESEQQGIEEQLNVAGTVDNGTISVSVTYDGEGVADVTVIGDDGPLGTTAPDGTLTFEAGDEDEFELTLLKGGFEAEIELEIEDGAVEIDAFELDESEDDDEDDEELSITVVSGEPAPGATVTLEVSDEDGPVADVPVEVEDNSVGTTDANGHITVTLPDDDEVEIEVEDGEREGELEFEFEEEKREDDDDREDEELSITVVSGEPAPGATVTLEVTADGNPIGNATVEIEDSFVGETGANGQITVTLPDDDEVEIEVEDGEREGELEFEFEEEDEEAEEEEDEEDEEEE